MQDLREQNGLFFFMTYNLDLYYLMSLIIIQAKPVTSVKQAKDVLNPLVQAHCGRK